MPLSQSRDKDELRIGVCNGACAAGWRDPASLAALASIPDLIGSDKARVVSRGRNLNVLLRLAGGREVFVKSFGRQARTKDWIDGFRGSKARRTWLAARRLRERGVGTPEPIGFMERWDGLRLRESYYLSNFEPGMLSFTAELARLFHEDPQCRKLIALMQCIADAVRTMHAAGFQHNDLGNQNILLRCSGDAEWRDAMFTDLNRGRIRDALTSRQKARDLSRIYLPSDLLRVFHEMYWASPVPVSFRKWESLYRGLYACHSATRRWRHPVRNARQAEADRGKRVYPREQDMWIWDERSGQAVNALRSRDRNRYYPFGQTVRIAGATLAAFVPVRREYRGLLAECYGKPVDMRGRIGVALEPKAEILERQFSLLNALGMIPVLIRFYHHESDADMDFRAAVVRRLHEEGHGVAIALVQDRNAVRYPERWRRFIERAVEKTQDHVEFIEAGHAINRVKWGIWSLAEHRELMRTVAEAAQGQPGLRFAGPAAIDFEYPYLLAALKNVPEGMRFHALSHHLYVDRRGAPENGQHGFSALEKLALARAIARLSPGCEDRLIISEVNWPLKGTGVYSPVGSPYESPGPRFNDPSVGECEYADYMVRYILAAICSGMAERVYWWRLAAHGYGLVDDAGGELRPRPAYRRLRYLLTMLGDAVFVKRIELRADSGVDNDSCIVFGFRRADGEDLAVAYTAGRPRSVEMPFTFDAATDAEGGAMETAGSSVRVTGTPVFLHGVIPACSDNL